MRNPIHIIVIEDANKLAQKADDLTSAIIGLSGSNAWVALADAMTLAASPRDQYVEERNYMNIGRRKGRGRW